MALEGVINGGDIVLYLGNEVLALSTSTTWNVEHKIRDTTCRESNAWNTYVAGDRAWSVECENLLAFRNSGGTTWSAYPLYTGIEELMKLYVLGRLRVRLKVAPFPLGSNNKSWVGSGYVTSVEIDTPNEENSTFSVSISGVELLRQTNTGTNQGL